MFVHAFVIINNFLLFFFALDSFFPDQKQTPLRSKSGATASSAKRRLSSHSSSEPVRKKSRTDTPGERKRRNKEEAMDKTKTADKWAEKGVESLIVSIDRSRYEGKSKRRKTKKQMISKNTCKYI